MNLDTSKWELFDFSKIFEIRKGFYNKKPEATEVGAIPFLGATDSNNGVTGYYAYQDIESSSRTGSEPNESINRKLFPGKAVCVTNNGSVGYAYYQCETFTCSHDVNPLYLRGGEFNEFTGMFIATVIMHDRYRWGYGRKWRPERMVKSQLKLPVLRDRNNNPVIDPTCKYSDEGFIPDWKFMENYIKCLHHNPLTTKNRPLQLELGIIGWKSFTLGRLFDIKKGKRLTSEDQEEGNYLYIGAIDSNNGVANHIGQKPIHQGNTLTLSYNGSVGEAFYQTDPYWATDDVNALYSKYDDFNRFIGLFMATVIRQEKYRFSYGRKWTIENMESAEIRLPIQHNPDGSVFIDPSRKYSDEGFVPDWQFMEDYIKALPFGDRI